MTAAATTPLENLTGVGPRLTERLARIGIHHPRDLLFHLPYRYQDRTRLTAIAELRAGVDALVLGRVAAVRVNYGRRRSLSVSVADAGGVLGLRFFHFSAAQQRGFESAAWVSCYGEVRRGQGGAEIVHPEYRLHREPPASVTEPSLTPVYPATEGVGANVLRKLTTQALASELDDLDECLPESVRVKFNLMPVADALKTVHRPPPDADTDALTGGVHPAQQRLAVEELLAHHLALSKLRQNTKRKTAPAFNAGGDSWTKLKQRLGFALTGAQRRVVDEVLTDLAAPSPMMRLLQGDVGAGKTVVAAAAALAAVDAGWQAALMAPTELLSEQHRQTFQRWFAPLGVEVAWLAGKMPAAARRSALARVADGGANFVVGTHALFQKQIEFHKLGLMIVDEQHRFGVDQRLALRNKAGGDGTVPHQLIMSATPIPRSLAMIFYADLDVSNLDELPPGRLPVQTIALPNSRRGEVAERIRDLCRENKQAYWVCPLIEESDKLQAQAATDTFDALKKLLPTVTIELIHGRMKSADKEKIMRRFHQGAIDLLVATTVIEVGVDVPAASLMVIENAERLGLAQLHQLRGRVGRGDAQASCVLMYQPPLGKLAKERLAILRDTNDGFVIANKDLEQRGPGELLGTRQTGLAQMKVADLARDRALLPLMERIARVLLAEHPDAADAITRRWLRARESYAEV